MKHLNIYAPKVVYLLLSGVLPCGHKERRHSLFPQQRPLLFRSVHFHGHQINEGGDEGGTLLN